MLNLHINNVGRTLEMVRAGLPTDQYADQPVLDGTYNINPKQVKFDPNNQP